MRGRLGCGLANTEQRFNKLRPRLRCKTFGIRSRGCYASRERICGLLAFCQLLGTEHRHRFKIMTLPRDKCICFAKLIEGRDCGCGYLCDNRRRCAYSRHALPGFFFKPRVSGGQGLVDFI